MSEIKVDDVLKERGSRYGEFRTHAYISQSLKETMRDLQCSNYADLRTFQTEALEMIAHKIARILNGDPDYIDNWVDIAGYAQLVVNELENTEHAE